MNPINTPPPSPERERLSTVAAESPTNPLSLCGLWALQSGCEDGLRLFLVAGEPQAGTFLLQRYDIVTEEPVGGYRPINLDDMAIADEDTGLSPWEFFDTYADVRAAVRRAFSRERA